MNIDKHKQNTACRSIVAVCVLPILLTCNQRACSQIYRWDNGQVIPGTEEITLTEASNLAGLPLMYGDFSRRELVAINMSEADLSQADFVSSRLARVNLEGSNLSNATLDRTNFWNVEFKDANLEGASIRGAEFHSPKSLLAEQFYSTGSYQAKDLRGVRFLEFDVNGWNFNGQDLRHAYLPTTANLANSDFTDATINYSVLAGITAEQLYSTASYQTRDLRGVTLSVDSSGWDLSNLNLSGAELGGGNLNDSTIKYANLSITNEQLYETASYKSKDLRGVTFGNNFRRIGNSTSWDFTGQDLTGAGFSGTVFDRAEKFAETNFTDANIAGVDLSHAVFGGFSTEHLYSTASYRAKDLRGIILDNNDLTRWNFADQDLTNAWLSSDLFAISSKLTDAVFSNANLTNVTLSGAELTNADFSGAFIKGADLRATRGLTQTQFYSTASYQERDLSFVQFGAHDLSNWEFSNMNLQNANFQGADLTNASFDGANLFGADFRETKGFTPSDSTILRNTILPDHRIRGLHLSEGDSLTLSARSYRAFGGSEVIVEEKLIVESGAVLEIGTHPAGFDIAYDGLVIKEPIPIEIHGVLRIFQPSNVWQNFNSGDKLKLFQWPDPLEPDNRFSSVELPAGRWDLSNLYTTGEIYLEAAYRHDGDLDVNYSLDQDDINRLSAAIRGGRDQTYDLNQDHLLDQQDLYHWIHEFKQTWIGDANLDGEFNSGDLVQVFQASQYEDGIELNSGWADGDWNGDGEFDTGDLVYAFQDGGYEMGRRATQAVPEPPANMWMPTLIMVWAFVGRERCRVRKQVCPPAIWKKW